MRRRSWSPATRRGRESRKRAKISMIFNEFQRISKSLKGFHDILRLCEAFLHPPIPHAALADSSGMTRAA